MVFLMNEAWPLRNFTGSHGVPMDFVGGGRGQPSTWTPGGSCAVGPDPWGGQCKGVEDEFHLRMQPYIYSRHKKYCIVATPEILRFWKIRHTSHTVLYIERSSYFCTADKSSCIARMRIRNDLIKSSRCSSCPEAYFGALNCNKSLIINKIRILP